MSLVGCAPTAQDLSGGYCDAIVCEGGNADLLALAVGGSPSGVRFKNGTSRIPGDISGKDIVIMEQLNIMLMRFDT